MYAPTDQPTSVPSLILVAWVPQFFPLTVERGQGLPSYFLCVACPLVFFSCFVSLNLIIRCHFWFLSPNSFLGELFLFFVSRKESSSLIRARGLVTFFFFPETASPTRWSCPMKIQRTGRPMRGRRPLANCTCLAGVAGATPTTSQSARDACWFGKSTSETGEWKALSARAPIRAASRCHRCPGHPEGAMEDDAAVHPHSPASLR